MNLDAYFISEIEDNLFNQFDNKQLLIEFLDVNNFTAKKNSYIFIPKTLNKSENEALFIGVSGCDDILDWVELGSKIGSKLKKDYEINIIPTNINIDVASFEYGLKLSAYSFDVFMSKKENKIQLSVNNSSFENEINNKIESVFWVRDMVNYPSLNKTPEFFIEKVKDLINNLNVDLEIYDQSWLIENNFGGVLGVSSGSIKEPYFLVGKYNTEAKIQIALIGKGVLFDSGGLSLKSPSGMETMKTDMAGAATSWGLIALLAKQRIDIGLTVYTPLVENMPSGTAIRPGDVLTMRNGKTIEVLNTDAEGRLIMADALAYASEFNPDIICDVATLTGSAYVALGLEVGAVFSNNFELANKFLDSNKESHERYHQLPLEKQYKKLIKSDIADMKNTGGSFGGAITAALLLEEFVNDNDWIHLDIAGPARSRDNDPLTPKGGTGFGVIGLYNFLRSLN